MNMIEKITIAITEPASVRLSSRNRGAFFFSSIVNVFIGSQRRVLAHFKCKDTNKRARNMKFTSIFSPRVPVSSRFIAQIRFYRISLPCLCIFSLLYDFIPLPHILHVLSLRYLSSTTSSTLLLSRPRGLYTFAAEKLF